MDQLLRELEDLRKSNFKAKLDVKQTHKKPIETNKEILMVSIQTDVTTSMMEQIQLWKLRKRKMDKLNIWYCPFIYHDIMYNTFLFLIKHILERI